MLGFVGYLAGVAMDVGRSEYVGYFDVGVVDLYKALRRRRYYHPSFVGVVDLYKENQLHDAIDWVEAENTFAVRGVVSEWFDALERGEGLQRYPDPRRKDASQEKADKLLSEMDADFELEIARFEGLHVEKGPEFSRFPPYTRLALAQSIHDVMMSVNEIEREAVRRLKEGIETPPVDQRISFAGVDYGV